MESNYAGQRRPGRHLDLPRYSNDNSNVMSFHSKVTFLTGLVLLAALLAEAGSLMRGPQVARKTALSVELEECGELDDVDGEEIVCTPAPPALVLLTQQHGQSDISVKTVCVRDRLHSRGPPLA